MGGRVAKDFWYYVRKERTGKRCWVWIGARRLNGYGQLKTGRRVRKAHQVAWEKENGPIPEGMCVLHKCDNPPCVRPSHLFVGTRRSKVGV